MADKTFIVTHAKARAPLSITGRTLNDALKKEGLDPAIWKEQAPYTEGERNDLGVNQGDARPEDN